MPHFDIVKAADVKTTYRVARVMADYDIKTEHANERFTGDIVFPEEWHIGCIVGGSGTGKSTIAKELFPENLWGGGTLGIIVCSGRYAEVRQHGRDRKNVLRCWLRKRPVMVETI